MSVDNPLWDEQRIANELLVKLGIRVSPRTGRKYLPKQPPGCPRGDQRWATFLRNHAKAIVACDFFVAAATFRLFFVLVLIEHGWHRWLHFIVTKHPTADWTLQQLREVIGFGDTHRYLLHDRDNIFAKSLDGGRLHRSSRLQATWSRQSTEASLSRPARAKKCASYL